MFFPDFAGIFQCLLTTALGHAGMEASVTIMIWNEYQYWQQVRRTEALEEKQAGGQRSGQGIVLVIKVFLLIVV